MATIVQESFTGGELSPELHARTSLAKYETGLALAKNTIIKAHGGAVNRPGTQFIGEIQDSDVKGRIIGFSFNTDQTYALEFGNQKLRVVKDAAYVLEANKTITAITQANPAVVTSNSHGFSNGDEIYVSSVVGMTQLNGKNFLVSSVTTNTFALQSLAGVNINSTGYTAYGSAGTAARIFTLATPYITADLPSLKFTQSADVLTITHRNYAVRDLTRTGHSNWTISEVNFTPTQTWPTGLSVSASTTGSVVYQYQVTAFNEENGEESLPGANTTAKTITAITKADPAVVTSSSHGFSDGDEVVITAVAGMTEVNGRRFKVANKTTNTFQLDGEDSSNYTTYASGGSASLTYFKVTNGAATADNVITWAAAADADSYSIYKYDNGLYGYIGTTEELTFTDDNIAATLTDTPPKERNPFHTDYPSTVTFFEQRKVYANTTLKPQTIFMSQSANYNNMTFSSPRKDDDSITRTIAAREVNEIRHLIPMSDLLCMTVGGEWRLFAGSNGVITPTSIIVKPQETHGCSDVRPLTVGGSVLYIQAQGNKVRDLQYKLESDMYSGSDLSILSEHFFDGHTLVDWCYAEIPFSVIWAVRDDGVLLGLTYLREHEVWAWHQHELSGGLVESICSIVEGNEDAVYMTVKRTINGRTVRFVERLHTRQFDEISDAFFVDCGLTYDDPKTITAITKANPAVVTSASHGFSNGDVVDISGLKAVYNGVGVQTGGMSELNGNGYIVAGVTTNTFQVTDSDGANVNSTSFATYVAGQGKVRKAITTITGLDHLEGESVYALANGDVNTGLTVSGGSVTLPNSASRVHIGYPYFADIQTLRPEVKSQNRPTVVGKKRKVSDVNMRVIDTRGLQAGPDADNLKEAQQGMVDITTGDIAMTIRPTWSKEGTIYVRQANPLPMEVIAISAEIEFES